MSDAFNIIDNSPAVIARLDEIIAQVSDLSPAMLAIGEYLTETTKERFSTSTAPDGKRWAPNAPSTLLARLNEISGAYSKKTGKLTKKGATVAINKKPLVASGLLQDSIRSQLADGGNGVEIGTDRFSGEWDGGAAVHHFGSRDGNIPARPIVGVSASDEIEVMQILNDFLVAQ
jgi:phage gpG-like protein